MRATPCPAATVRRDPRVVHHCAGDTRRRLGGARARRVTRRHGLMAEDNAPEPDGARHDTDAQSPSGAVRKTGSRAGERQRLERRGPAVSDLDNANGTRTEVQHRGSSRTSDQTPQDNFSVDVGRRTTAGPSAAATAGSAASARRVACRSRARARARSRGVGAVRPSLRHTVWLPLSPTNAAPGARGCRSRSRRFTARWSA